MKALLKISAALAVILATFLLSDFIFGLVADGFTQRRGLTKQQYFLSSREDYDLIFLGSSRANHHYDTPYIADSLGIRAFNAGQDGRGLSYQYPLLKAYLSHHKPRLVVLEMHLALDGARNGRIALLYPLAEKYEEIGEAAELLDPANKLYLRSALYRYNSNLVYEARGILHPYSNVSLGYDPLPPKKVPEDMLKEEKRYWFPSEIDPTECRMLENIISLCKDRDIPLVGVISPVYERVWRTAVIDSILQANHIPLIDNSAYRLPLDAPEYFRDEMHLNAVGAREYTKYFMRQIADTLRLI